MDIAPTYPIYNQGYNPLTIRGMNHQVEYGTGWMWIPKAIGFRILAGVDPIKKLHLMAALAMYQATARNRYAHPQSTTEFWIYNNSLMKYEQLSDWWFGTSMFCFHILGISGNHPRWLIWRFPKMGLPLQGGAPPQWCLLVYNPNNYRYNPLINPSYSSYKPS